MKDKNNEKEKREKSERGTGNGEREVSGQTKDSKEHGDTKNNDHKQDRRCEKGISPFVFDPLVLDPLEFDPLVLDP